MPATANITIKIIFYLITYYIYMKSCIDCNQNDQSSQGQHLASSLVESSLKLCTNLRPKKMLFFFFSFCLRDSCVFCSSSCSIYFCFAPKILINLKYDNSYITFPHSTCYIAKTIRIPILKCTNFTIKCSYKI